MFWIFQIANILWITEKATEFQKNICFIDYAKASDCVDHNKLWKILRDGNIRPPDLPPEKSVCRSGSNSWNWTWNNTVSPSAIPRVSSLPDGLTVSTGPNGVGRAQGLGGGGRSVARLWTHTSRFLRVSRIWNFMINNRAHTLKRKVSLNWTRILVSAYLKTNPPNFIVFAP